MCEWNQKEKAKVLTPEGMEEVEVDSCLKPLLEGLSGAGIVTVGCCYGHGKDCPTVLLADGRTLYVLNEKPWEGWRLICWAVKKAWREMWFWIGRELGTLDATR
jgi:hypothetical protein